jgi:hypothetical protein
MGNIGRSCCVVVSHLKGLGLASTKKEPGQNQGNGPDIQSGGNKFILDNLL